MHETKTQPSILTATLVGTAVAHGSAKAGFHKTAGSGRNGRQDTKESTHLAFMADKWRKRISSDNLVTRNSQHGGFCLNEGCFVQVEQNLATLGGG